MIIAGTGSRSFTPDKNSLGLLVGYIKEFCNNVPLEYVEFELMSGMAEGFDEFIASSAVKLGIPFHAAVPNSGYGDYYWGKHSLSGRNRIDQFDELLSAAKSTTFVCNSIYENGVHANFLRNQYMVDNSDGFVVYNPESSGTKDCFRRIKLKRLPYRIFA